MTINLARRTIRWSRGGARDQSETQGQSMLIVLPPHLREKKIDPSMGLLARITRGLFWVGLLTPNTLGQKLTNGT